MTGASRPSNPIAAAAEAFRQGRWADAESLCVQLLRSRPDDADGLALLGAVLVSAGKAGDALEPLSRAAALRPDGAEVRSNLGYALTLLQRPAEALPHLDAAIARDPGFVAAHNNRGLALLALDRAPEALAAFDQALALDADHLDALTNRGNALLKLGHHDRALAAYDRALAINPNFALAHFNRGKALGQLNRLSEAVAAFDGVLAARPDDAEALWAKGMTLLLGGDFAAGWRLYEWRWRAPSFGHAPRALPRPLWLDESSLAGRTILVHAEQGFGDTLQFCRYIPVLAARGARVLFLAQTELMGVLRASNLPCELFVSGDRVPAFDVHCPLMSLPHALGTALHAIPATTPYLAPPPDKLARWASLLGPQAKRRVGLAWSGRRTHKQNAMRSIDLAALAPILACDAEFHCLQTEFAEADRARLASIPGLKFFPLAERDFGDTAAHIAAMDLVISVDTSIVHLAGALGKPVWTLLAFSPDFRWMLNRADSPWYPGMRLIRQSRPDDWSEVIATVSADLTQWLSG